MDRSIRWAIVLAALALVLPAVAAAGSRELYEEYRRGGAIDGCAHGSGELSAALSGVPADIKAYDPGFADALNVALERRAAGCRGDAAAADPLVPVAVAGTRRASDGSPGPRDPPTPAAPAAAEFAAEEFPVGALLVAIGAAAALLAGSLAWGRGGGRGER